MISTQKSSTKIVTVGDLLRHIKESEIPETALVSMRCGHLSSDEVTSSHKVGMLSDKGTEWLDLRMS